MLQIFSKSSLLVTIVMGKRELKLRNRICYTKSNKYLYIFISIKKENTSCNLQKNTYIMYYEYTGQEYMASYFNLLRAAETCAVSQMKAIEWKLSHVGWWVKRMHHDFIPCPCPVHNRTPLDILRFVKKNHILRLSFHLKFDLLCCGNQEIITRN